MRRHYRSFRGDVSSVLYRLIYGSLLLLGVKLFGLSIFDDIILVILGIAVFEIVGFILRKIGFWRYYTLTSSLNTTRYFLLFRIFYQLSRQPSRYNQYRYLCIHTPLHPLSEGYF